MKTLGELTHYISKLPAPVPFIGVSVAHWDSIREEARQWCEDNDETFSSSTSMTEPNFCVYGIPIIAAGHA